MYVRALVQCRNYRRASDVLAALPKEAEGDPAVRSLRAAVAVGTDDLAEAHRPEARATDRGNYYLRYNDSIAIVGPGSGQACTVRLESLNSGYNHGSYFFLGPGFSPGSPSHSSGGSSGGPGGVK